MPKLFPKISPQIISSFVLLVITGALLLTCTFTLAWFSTNRSVSATGMHITVADKRITLDDTIVVTRTLSTNVTTKTYRCIGEDSYYYLYEDNDFALDEQGNRIPLLIPNLLPGEFVDVTFAYTCTDSLIGTSISAYLSDISSDTFAEIDHPDVLHSVLGVYKFSVKHGANYSDGVWVVNYSSGIAEPTPKTLPVFTDVAWNKVSDTPENNYVYVTFRFKFDLSQYDTLKTATNLLSEKKFSIGELRIEVTENE